MHDLLNSFLPEVPSHKIQALLDYAKSIGTTVVDIPITGGPCGCKSTSLTILELEFKQQGWFVVMVPEAATIVRGQGFKAETGVVSGSAAQQLMVLLNEFLYLSALTTAIAAGHKRILIFRDRCALDGAAYMPTFDDFALLVENLGFNINDLKRSSGVIHLNSVACEYPDLYTKLQKTNPQRFETAEEAAAADEKTFQAYRHFGIDVLRVPNLTQEEADKIRAVINAVREIIGVPQFTKERAYLVQGGLGSWIQQFSLTRPIEIEQFYMLDGSRYRKMKYPNTETVYIKTTHLKSDDPNINFADQALVLEKEYLAALNGTARDESTSIVRKLRYFVEYEDYQFQIDKYDGLIGDVVRVEVKYTSDKTDTPTFIKERVFKEVSGLLEYSNTSIAKGTMPMEW